VINVAALDLGTNTFRLMVAEVEAGKALRSIRKEQVITRLGGGFDKATGRLSDAALDRAGETLRFFARVLAEEKVDAIAAKATAIVREATNGVEFLDMAGRILGFDVRTLSPEEEAAVALRGILAYNPPVDGPFVTLDVGGGSAELALVVSDELRGWVSMPVGVVDIAERVLADTDPPSEFSLAECENEVTESLEAARKKLGAPEYVDVVVGTGGTATSMAAIDLGLEEYDEEAVQNHRLSLEYIRELESRLASLSFAERSEIFPLGGGREDVIIPGIITTRVTLEIFSAGEMLVSDAGLLEGLALTCTDKIERR